MTVFGAVSRRKLPPRRCRLRADVDEPLHREHRRANLAIPRAVPRAALHGCLAGAMDRADAARARRGALEDRPRRARRTAQGQAEVVPASSGAYGNHRFRASIEDSGYWIARLNRAMTDRWVVFQDLTQR